MSWSVGTTGSGRVVLAVAGSLPPAVAWFLPESAADSASDGAVSLDMDLKGFHAGAAEEGAGAGPLTSGLLPSGCSSLGSFGDYKPTFHSLTHSFMQCMTAS